MFTGLAIAGGVVLLLAIFQRRNLGLLIGVGGAYLNKGVRKLRSIDPITIYQAEVDRATEEISSAKEGLEQYRGLVARLERQVANNEKEEARLSGKIKTYLTEGNEDRAGEYAIMLKKEQDHLKENKSQRDAYKATYDLNVKKIKAANDKISQAQQNAQKLQADLNLSKAEAETAKLAESFNVKTSKLDSLGQINDEIQKQIDTNRAKGQVLRDLSQDGLDELEEEERQQKAEAKLMLEEFRKENLKQITNQ